MKLIEYQEKAISFILPSIKDEVLYFVLGLAGEAGEVSNKFKKVLRDHDGQLKNEQALELAHELGDCLWYIATIASEVLKLDLETIAKWNLTKLGNRHPKANQAPLGDEIGENFVDSLLRLYDQQQTDPAQIEVFKGLRSSIARYITRGMAK